MRLPFPEIQVFPPEKRGDTWRAAGVIRFGGSDPIYVAARTSDRFVSSLAIALQRSGANMATMGGMVGASPGAPDPNALLQSLIAALRKIPGMPAGGIPGMPGGSGVPGGLPNIPGMPGGLPNIPGMPGGIPGMSGGGFPNIPGMPPAAQGAVQAAASALPGILGSILGGGGGGGAPGGGGGIGDMLGGLGGLFGAIAGDFVAPAINPGDTPIRILPGWSPWGLAKWFTGDPERFREMVRLNGIVKGEDGNPRPWDVGQIVMLPASWGAAGKRAPRGRVGPIPGVVGANFGDHDALEAFMHNPWARSVLEHGGSVDGSTLRGLESRGELYPPGHPLYGVPAWLHPSPYGAPWFDRPSWHIGGPYPPGHPLFGAHIGDGPLDREVAEAFFRMRGESPRIGADPTTEEAMIALSNLVARAVTSAGVTKTALDIAEFLPMVGTVIKLARSSAHIAHGLLSRHPGSMALFGDIERHAMRGNAQATALLNSVEEAIKALRALRAAQGGDPRATSALFRVVEDARRGVPKAVETVYVLEGARDASTPDLRDETLDADTSPSEVSGDPRVVGAWSLLQGMGGVEKAQRPSDASDQWLSGVLRDALSGSGRSAVGCAF